MSQREINERPSAACKEKSLSATRRIGDKPVQYPPPTHKIDPYTITQRFMWCFPGSTYLSLNFIFVNNWDCLHTGIEMQHQNDEKESYNSKDEFNWLVHHNTAMLTYVH